MDIPAGITRVEPPLKVQGVALGGCRYMEPGDELAPVVGVDAQLVAVAALAVDLVEDRLLGAGLAQPLLEHPDRIAVRDAG